MDTPKTATVATPGTPKTHKTTPLIVYVLAYLINACLIALDMTFGLGLMRSVTIGLVALVVVVGGLDLMDTEIMRRVGVVRAFSVLLYVIVLNILFFAASYLSTLSSPWLYDNARPAGWFE